MPEHKSGSGAIVAVGNPQAAGRGFERPPDGHEIYSLVGQIASEWAHLEHLLDRVIYELAEILSPRGGCITAQMMGVWPRFNAITALLTLRSAEYPKFKPLIPKAKSLSGRARDISEARNRVIHDPWYIDHSSPPETAQFKNWAKTDLRFGIRDSKIDDAKKTLAQIKSYAEAALKFHQEVVELMKPIYEKRRAKQS